MKENKAKAPRVFFSNRAENLADNLLKQLFGSQSAPFEPRVVIVPDVESKTYLLYRFAKDPRMHVAAGLQMLTLSEAVQELLRKQKKQKPFYLPSPLELSIKLEDELFYLISTRKDHTDEEKILFQDLWAYLGLEEEQKRSSQLRTKVISLCEELSSVFALYGVYEMDFLDKWLDKKGWKQALWKKIYSEGSLWTFPQKKLREGVSSNEKIHIFGFSFLPRVYFDFFNLKEASYYFLSPCELFWEDLYSDKERIFLQKILEGKKVKLGIREQLNFYLKDSNPLLSNWGKMGREFIKLMGEKEVFIEEEDYVSESLETPFLLQKVQEDLLQLYNKEDRKDVLFSEDDASIKLISASSKLREVEILLETLYELIEKDNKKNDSIEPNEITVLSPRLAEYLPYIHMVFGAPDCRLDYTIRDVECLSQDDFMQAFEHLVSLPEKRFDLLAFQKLFSFSCFQRKWGWKREDVSLLLKWFEKAGVRWGFDAVQKTKFLSNGLQEEISTEESGTWLHGFEQLLMGLGFTIGQEDVPEDFSWSWPLNTVEWSDSELLGQVIHILRSLAKDVVIFEEVNEKTFSEWINDLQNFAMTYLAYEEENPLFYELKRLNRVFEGELQSVFSFQSFLRIFKQVRRKKKETFQGSHLQAVKFCSLRNGKVLPAKVIYLLGVEEESFPRPQPQLSLNELQSISKKEYIPSKIEEDRYLFLEVLLSARKYFIMSYQRISSEDQKPQNPSPIIQEFFSYLDLFYRSDKGRAPSQVLSFSHPALSFHKSYFEKESSLKSYSFHHALAAKSYYSLQKGFLPPFFPEFYSPVSFDKKREEKTVMVSIKELNKFAKHPIKFFFQDILGIYFDSLFKKEEEEFIFPAYERAFVRTASLEKSFESVMKMTEAKGKLPTGLFKQLAIKKTEKEVASIKDNLLEWHIEEEDLFSIELSSNCKEIFCKEKNWIFPALVVKNSLGTSYVIEGIIPNLSSSGMLYYGEDALKDLISIWPLYLIYSSLPSFEKMRARDLFLTKEGVRKSFCLENPLMLLSKYLDYFEESKKSASPLLPIWAELLLLKTPSDFEKKMKDKSYLATSPFPDDYLRWLFLRDEAPTANVIYQRGSKQWQEIFGPLLTQGAGNETL